MIYDKINHASHEHRLKLECYETPYKCDGCQEIGFGSRYRCKPCNYDLHKDCALATPHISHPFFEKCDFKFFTHVPGTRERYCDGCGRDVQGFVYHCTTCGRDLHPCCANLPRVVGDNEVKLHLHHKVRSKCQKCGWMERRKWATSWSYVSTCEGYCFHVSCVKDMLLERWEKGCFVPYGEVEENGLALEARVPSLQLTLPNNGGASGKYKKYWRIFKIALKFIISVLVGDPTAVVGGLITSVVSS